MDFKEQIKQIAKSINTMRDSIITEEATKTAFILPFIQTLGYNIFNPLEVTPEYTADLGLKQGEKVDYAIQKDNAPILFIECKKIGAELNIQNESQLLRYFHTSTAKFAILTNGETYNFYSDLEEKNKMDKVPFLSFKITEIKDNQINELKKFHKENFDFDNILETATDLKYESELRRFITGQLANPDEEFIKFFAKSVYSSVCTKKVIDQFTPLVKRVFNQLINDAVTERLQSALNKENEKQKETQEKEVEPEEPKIITTDEEMSAFFIIRAILCKVVPIEKITFRDAQSYFSVFYDDNNRKQICRLYLEDSKKRIGLINANKEERKEDIEQLSDIYKFEKELEEVALFYYNQDQN